MVLMVRNNLKTFLLNKGDAMKSLLLVLVFLLGACSKVPTGHVGLKVYLLGNRGVDQEVLGVGRYFI